MKREIINTNDGSKSLFVPALNETYHSIHGAIAEAQHVFLKKGFSNFISRSEIHVLEIGFGTGLNALITAVESEKASLKVKYTSIEKYPVDIEDALALEYGKRLNHPELFKKLHEARWAEEIQISPHFQLEKIQLDLKEGAQENLANRSFDLIYFDAFAPNKQADMWSLEIFELMYNLLNTNGILTTYCCQGQVRRTMLAAGFEVEKTDGPPGKREMLVALKK